MRTTDLFLSSAVKCAASRIDALAVPTSSIWQELRHLEPVYPGFKHWYWHKVVPGLPLGRRRMFVSIDGGQISGIVIAKRESEKKICTVWVSPQFRKRALARDLMENAMTWLETSRPLFTVPEERMGEFSKLIDYFAFERRDVVRDFYGYGRTEHVFNGFLLPPYHA